MENKNFVEQIANFNEDLPQWYTDVILKADLCDYGPVKGTMVIKPYGYAIWENIQSYLDKEFKKVGVKNAYFPMLIPESFIKKEAKHVEGFAPEVAVVTYAGGQDLTEKLIVRPTSETIICEMYSKWIKSYRDLPMVMNQWCNVVRWEKTTRPFLRTSEFLWQEGHTVQASPKEAKEDALKMLEIYKDMAKNLLAIPMLSGRKSDREKFAGANDTYGIEAVMPDGKCLQSGTTHDLGQNFAKAANIKFLNKDGEWEYGYSTSWGVSTRLIGALIMVHGDERGIKLPPNVAPIQTIIVPVAMHKDGVIDKAYELKKTLEDAGIRAEIDATDNTPGWKFNEYEMKGVPLRIEIGPRDIESNQCVCVRRDTHEKSFVSLDNVQESVKELLNTIQTNMYDLAKKFVDSCSEDVSSMEELVKVVDNKKVGIGYHCGNEECEQQIKNETGIQTRVIISECDEKDEHTCIHCGKKAKHKIYFARQY
ncbi:MAG: proline--tRNA ligase [Clostridiales bacterium]|nr:proline--tRNA ligase [Candidatus Apopatousia equi]